MKNKLKVLIFCDPSVTVINESIGNILKSMSLKYKMDMNQFVVICPNNVERLRGYLKDRGLVIKAYNPNMLQSVIKFANYCIFYKSDNVKEVVDQARSSAEKLKIPFAVEIV
jgi:hypothetical protein